VACPFGTRHLSIDIINLDTKFSKSLPRRYLPRAKTRKVWDPWVFWGALLPAGLSRPAAETPVPAQVFQFHNTICEGSYPPRVELDLHPDHAWSPRWWQILFWIGSSYGKCVALIWSRVARPHSSYGTGVLNTEVERRLGLSQSLLELWVVQDVLTYHWP